MLSDYAWIDLINSNVRCCFGLEIVVTSSVGASGLALAQLPVRRAAGVAHDGAEFVQEGRKAMRWCSVSELAAGGFYFGCLGSFGGCDGGEHQFAPSFAHMPST